MTVQHPRPASPKMTADSFMEMIESRPREERWQLIDGEPFLMMSPPTIVHQRISLNLALLLNDALYVQRPSLFALIEVGLVVESQADFRPVADLAVVDAEAEQIHYAPRFYMAAEILSPSNTREHISRKRRYYAESPDCLHVLIVAQDDFCIEVWSRSSTWQGRVFRAPDDLIELTEFGFSCRLGDLYRGTPIFSEWQRSS